MYNKLKLTRFVLSLSIASTLPFLAACHNDEAKYYGDAANTEVDVIDEPEQDSGEAMSKHPSVVVAAQSVENLSVLAEAVVAAGLVDTLSATDGSAPFTVFAPTDEAFAEVLTTLGMTKEQLFADKSLLTKVLTYHVLANASVKAADITFNTAIPSINGNSLTIENNQNKVQLVDTQGNKANVIATDVITDNGVVHIIDKVILPETKNLVQIAQANENFSILVEAVVAADLVDTLANGESLTVFAPTNDAFVNLLTELELTKEQLFANKELLTKVLTYHVLQGRVFSSQVAAGEVTTVQGGSFSFTDTATIKDGKENSVSLQITDINAANGVIHVIDKVLLPE